jgi:hypothetical protein
MQPSSPLALQSSGPGSASAPPLLGLGPTWAQQQQPAPLRPHVHHTRVKRRRRSCMLLYVILCGPARQRQEGKKGTRTVSTSLLSPTAASFSIFPLSPIAFHRSLRSPSQMPCLCGPCQVTPYVATRVTSRQAKPHPTPQIMDALRPHCELVRTAPWSRGGVATQPRPRPVPRPRLLNERRHTDDHHTSGSVTPTIATARSSPP